MFTEVMVSAEVGKMFVSLNLAQLAPESIWEAAVLRGNRVFLIVLVEYESAKQKINWKSR